MCSSTAASLKERWRAAASNTRSAFKGGRRYVTRWMSFSYARGENSSFVHAGRRPYIHCMKNRYPTTEELYALEIEARRLRTAEMSRLLKAGAQAVRSLAARIVTVRHAKGWKHA